VAGCECGVYRRSRFLCLVFIAYNEVNPLFPEDLHALTFLKSKVC